MAAFIRISCCWYCCCSCCHPVRCLWRTHFIKRASLLALPNVQKEESSHYFGNEAMRYISLSNKLHLVTEYMIFSFSFFLHYLLRGWSTYLLVPNLSSFQVWRQTGSLRVSVGLSSTRTRSYKNIFSPNKLFYAGI